MPASGTQTRASNSVDGAWQSAYFTFLPLSPTAQGHILEQLFEDADGCRIAKKRRLRRDSGDPGPSWGALCQRLAWRREDFGAGVRGHLATSTLATLLLHEVNLRHSGRSSAPVSSGARRFGQTHAMLETPRSVPPGQSSRVRVGVYKAGHAQPREKCKGTPLPFRELPDLDELPQPTHPTRRRRRSRCARRPRAPRLV